MNFVSATDIVTIKLPTDVDPNSAVFQALVDAVSSQVVTRLTPVIDTVASNSLHVMYQVRLAMI